MFTVQKSFLRAPLVPALAPQALTGNPQGNVDTPMRNSGPAAIFTRNHSRMLDFALSAAGEDPKRLVTFRSAKMWKGARELLRSGSEVLVYFTVIDDGPMVRFVARLREVLPAPDTKFAAAERLLLSAPPHTVRDLRVPPRRAVPHDPFDQAGERRAPGRELQVLVREGSCPCVGA